FHQRHDLAHVFRGGGSARGDGAGDQRVELRIAHAGGQISLENGDFGALLRHQVGAAARLELGDRFPALFDHLLQDREDLAVIERDPLVDFALFDGGERQTYGGEALFLARAQGALHVLRDAFLEGHAGTSAGGAHALTRDALHVALDGGRLLAFPLLGRLLVEFTPAQLGENAGLLARALETPQGGIEVLILTDTDARHRNLRRTGKTGRAILVEAHGKGKSSCISRPRSRVVLRRECRGRPGRGRGPAGA